jgi:hypothetical protein
MFSTGYRSLANPEAEARMNEAQILGSFSQLLVRRKTASR